MTSPQAATTCAVSHICCRRSVARHPAYDTLRLAGAVCLQWNDAFVDARALLVVIVGRPGTGKTTLAKRLTRELNGAYIRIDAIVGPILRARPTEDVGAVRVGYEIGREVAQGNLELGVPVIVDGLHATHTRRQQWLDVAASTRAHLEFLETFLSDDDEHRRRVERRSSGESGYLGPWWHEVQAMTYEPWDDSRSGSRLAIETSDADSALAAAMSHLRRSGRSMSDQD